jgi:hypothetical protein
MEDMGADDLVLVAIIRTRRDLEIARLLGWYRIPIQSAPKTIRVDWLAFYQTADFGEQRWSVRYVAPVTGFEMVRRLDLIRDEPEHPQAQAPYYKVQLGALQALPNPIMAARWRRFTFLYTTGERLLRARRLRELTVAGPAERDRLWRIIGNQSG